MRADRKKEETIQQVFNSIGKIYDKANVRISLGMQGRWKRRLVREACAGVPAGGTLLDVCCGTGDIALAFAKLRPDCRVTGLDFSSAMLREARRRGRKLENLRLLEGNALRLPFEDNSFQAAAISFGLRNAVSWEQCLAEILRVLVPGGRFFCLDSFVPENRFIRPFYALYFRGIMPLLGGGIRHRREYQWLWQSTQDFLSKRELARLMGRIGYESISCRSFLFGACLLFCGKTRRL